MEGEIQPYLALETNFGARIYLYQLPDESVVGKIGHQPPATFSSKAEADKWLQVQITGRTLTELKPEDSPPLAPWVKFDEYQVEKVEVLTPQIRVEKEQPAGGKSHQSQRQAEPSQPGQTDRAATKDSNNNRPEQLPNDPADDPPGQSNAPRADKTEPETSEGGDATESFGDQTERQVAEFFGEGQKGASVLKGQLGDYVSEGGDPFLGALGATGLDALNFAMGFAEGTIAGILDTRNLGEGLKKGTPEGAKEDAARLLNILPQGRVARVLNTALTVSDLADAAASHDVAGVTLAAGMALAHKGGKGKAGRKGNQKSRRIANGRRRYLKEVAKEFQSTYANIKKRNPDALAREISTKAHARTQHKIRQRFGRAIVEEPFLGVTHFGRKKYRFNMGARGDITNNDLLVMTELKANVNLKNGQIEVNKKIDGEWRSAYTDQIKSLEAHGKSNTEWLTTIVTSKGEVLIYEPKLDNWSKLK